jgi:hypothetical protein
LPPLLTHPTPSHPTPQDLADWACIYLRYLQVLRKLELAYDQMVHPQKRLDMKRALEACMGRLLEVRHWMVSGAGAPSSQRSRCGPRAGREARLAGQPAGGPGAPSKGARLGSKAACSGTRMRLLLS